MTRTVMTVELDDPLNDELGLKEAAVMALEPLGGRVRVTVVRTIGEEQLTMAGAVPERPSRPGPGRKPATSGQAPTRPRPRVPAGLGCCLDCAHFREEHRRGGDGTLLWGVCRRDGRWRAEANKRCDAWAGTADRI